MAYDTTHNEVGELEMSCKSGSLPPWVLRSHHRHSLGLETPVLVPVFERCARAGVRRAHPKL